MAKKQASIKGLSQPIEGVANLQACLDYLDAVVEANIVECANTILDLVQSEPPVGNPVGTEETSRHPGLSRESWYAYIDTYAEGLTLGEPTYGKVEISIEGKNSGRFRKSRRGGTVTFDVKQNQNILIVNHQPYMARLNRGWSQQSPPGWIDSAIDAGYATLL